MKRGQAFLITSVILIMILVAFFTIVNYSKKTNFSKLDSLAEQIQIESEKVMDYDLKNNKNNIEEFKLETSNNLDDDTEIYFIDETNCENCDSYEIDNDKIKATIDDSTYEFSYFPEGKHFYYVMISKSGGEIYVYKN